MDRSELAKIGAWHRRMSLELSGKGDNWAASAMWNCPHGHFATLIESMLAAPPPPAEQASGEMAEARELLAAELDAIRFPAMAAEVRDPEGYNSCGAAMVRAVARVIAALSQRTSEQASGELCDALLKLRQLERETADAHGRTSAEWFKRQDAALDAAIAALSQRPVVPDGMVMVQKHDALILADFATANGGVMEQLAARRVSALAPQQPEKGEG